METIAIARVRRDGGTQPRSQVDDSTVAEYAEDMKRGDKFPPIKVMFDGTDYWVYDGFHRLDAAVSNGNTFIAADVTQGTQRDAILKSLSANAHHGKRRTHEDIKRVCLRYLEDPEWGVNNSLETIALHCAVSTNTAKKYRDIVKENQKASGTGNQICNLQNSKTTGKDGKSYPQSKPRKPKEPQDGKATTEVVDTATTAGSVAEPEESETQPARSSSDPIKDPRGNPVPENLVDVFSDSVWGEIDATAKKLTSLIDRAASGPGGFYLTKDMENKNGSRRLTSFEAAKNSIFHCKPYGVCPACLGECCKHCYQKGFLAKLTYKQVEGMVS